MGYKVFEKEGHLQAFANIGNVIAVRRIIWSADLLPVVIFLFLCGVVILI